MGKLILDDISIKRIGRDWWEQIMPMARDIASDGTSYVFTPDFTDKDLKDYWLNPEAFLFAAFDKTGKIIGFYKIIANQPGRGSHVANASYIVGSDFRGSGLGEIMAFDSFNRAVELGFSAMQFNIVVSTNKAAVQLWTKVGFTIVGTVPMAFNHPSLGLVDIYVMHRFL